MFQRISVVLALVVAVAACANPAQGRVDAGVKLAAEKDWKNAIAAFDEAIALDPGLTDAYLDRAFARDAVYDQSGAMADLDVVIERRPNDVRALVDRAALRARAGDATGAVDEAKRGEENSSSADLMRAIDDATQALALRPSDTHALLYRGLAHIDLHESDLGIADLRAARASTTDESLIEIIDSVLSEVDR